MRMSVCRKATVSVSVSASASALLLMMMCGMNLSSVYGEIKTFSGPLNATSSSVRFITSYLIDPGYVDLTYVTFTAVKGSALFINDDDRYKQTFDDDDDFAFADDDDFIDMTDDNDNDNDLTDDLTDTEDHEQNENNDTPPPTSTPTSRSFATATPSYKLTNSPTEQSSDIATDNTTDIATDKITTTETTATTTTTTTTTDTTSNSTIDNNQNENATGNDGNNDNNNSTRTRHSSSRDLVLKEFTIDVLFFHEPTECAKTKEGCDWTIGGIGNSDSSGNIRWCCSQDAVSLGFCEPTQIGRMIINTNKYKGIHRFITIPAEGEFQGTVPYPVMTTEGGSGQYTLVMANCNDYGRDLQLDGYGVWKSKGGFLPGDLHDEWIFVILLTVGYATLLIWYGYSMKQNKDSIIGIQKWILCTISLGLVETFLETVDYSIWNTSGLRSIGTTYLWIFIGVLKGSISRCLLIMVCLGWGVIRDTLGDQMKKIVVLGLVYLLVASLRDVFGIVFVEEIQVLSEERESEIYDIFTLFTLISAGIDVVCYMWILDALNGTMQYLENMNQTMKLKRYLRLRLFLLLSILFGTFWSIMGIVNELMETAVLAENQDWVIPAAWSVNYFLILVSVAFLWRPNPQAKEFAYVMELPSVGQDLDFETNIGTIGLDDNDDTDIHQSYSGGLQEHENGMNINNAVAS